MKSGAEHIKKIIVVSNTHWDREFRRSFEKTRRRLLDMLDTTIDILERDPAYPSFTMDGHSIMIEDYLEMRPERREQVKRLVRGGRLILGPYYTLAEEFSIGHEPLVRNLLFGRKTVEALGGKTGRVAYTPSSWGQTGQLPQIFADFGLRFMMFYRGVSHHECDAEWVWEAPDGTRMLASRFAIYCRYNWYYRVHRAVTTGRVFEKDYQWGEFDECPVRPADGMSGEDLSFDVQRPARLFHPERLKQAVEDMIRDEAPHFTTSVFLAMNGHDISVAHPDESRVVEEARKLFEGIYDIRHGSLEDFWDEAEKELEPDSMTVLKGERRSYLKEGMWTFLFPGTISSRTYLKQEDFEATARLVYGAEPLACLAACCGANVPSRYLERSWRALLSNHTHDANGGCAPDAVCEDMRTRYRQVCDTADIVTDDAMRHMAANLSPKGQSPDALQLVVFNSLPVVRDAVMAIDLEIPAAHGARAARLEADDDPHVPRQAIADESSSSFVDSIWEVPRILDSHRVRFYARFRNLPACGYRAYRVAAEGGELRENATLVTGPVSMANEYLSVRVNGNGTIDLTCLRTGRTYTGVNYLHDQGEVGNSWKHVPPAFDRIATSLGCAARLEIVETGPLLSSIAARFDFEVPSDAADGAARSEATASLPVEIVYTLKAGERSLGVQVTLENRARDHWLRIACPTELKTDHSVADSHFDVVHRPIELPDSTGWVERAYGTHPLRTFVDLSDGTDGLALLPKGLFEYEVFDDPARTLALTLLRGCRIKLAVSEEKQTELPDEGIQCPGRRVFEYSICPHAGDWRAAGLLNEAALRYAPARALQCGRGQGALPDQMSMVEVDGEAVHVTAVKPAEDGAGTIVRLFNPLDDEQMVFLRSGAGIQCAERCALDERVLDRLPVDGNAFAVEAAPRKIVTLRIR